MASPQPVKVTNPEPIPVTLTETTQGADTDSTAQSDAKVIAAAAHVDARALQVADQRRISGIWETTQRLIAISVVETALVVVALLVITPGLATILDHPVPEAASAAASTGMVFLASVANLVIGFYFGRTNHQRVGGDTSADSIVGR